jgi:hypothetical protein
MCGNISLLRSSERRVVGSCSLDNSSLRPEEMIGTLHTLASARVARLTLLIRYANVTSSLSCSRCVPFV